MNFSLAIQAGHLVRDPELRYRDNGSPVVEFTVATNFRYKDKEDVSFIGCVAWGKTAETIAEYFKKGDAIHVTGRLTQSTWEDKEGNKREKTKISVGDFRFVKSKKKDEDLSAETPPEEKTEAEPF